MKHLETRFGVSGLPDSGCLSKATYDSVHGLPSVLPPPLHSECSHRTMGICLHEASSHWHLLRLFLPIASNAGQMTCDSEELELAGKLVDRSGRSWFA